MSQKSSPRCAAPGADTVAVSNTEYLGAEGMRVLAWELEAVDVTWW